MKRKYKFVIRAGYHSFITVCIVAVVLLIGVLACSAQTSIYLFSGSETNVTLNPGFYDIAAYGAQGGGQGLLSYSGGLGAEMAGRFYFSAPTTLALLVGGSGSGVVFGGAGGGGGSFVVNGSFPLIIAGGGGGAGASSGGNGNTVTSGSSGVGGTPGGGTGGTGGNGGGAGSATAYYGGGGGGFSGDGGGGSSGAGGGGKSFLNGGDGGAGGGAGGYGGGGGGGGDTIGGGGGGGGYSGGGGGGWGNDLGGGGGGSIVDSSAILAFARVSGVASPDGSPNGEIIITAVPAPTNAGPFMLSAFLFNGTFIRSVTTADANNDGKPDLICVRGNPSVLSVWTNSRGGIFVSNASYAVGSFPYQVITADVNNDGWPDAVTANNSGNSLTVLTNDGYGGYVLSATLAEGSGQAPHSVAAADLFGRGRMDLISANSQSASFTIWTNSGSGTFGSNISFTVGTPQQTVPQWVTTADVNGDGKPDIIGACNNSGTYLSIWTNNGVGGFASAPAPHLLNGLACVTTTDVNGDRKLDLILLSSQVMVLTNNGSGGFATAGSYAVGTSPYAVVATDVNGDEAMDLITCNQGDNTLTVLTNNGGGVFGSNATLNVGSEPESLAATDVNGDGRVDLISGDWNDGTLTVLTNTATFLPKLTLKWSGNAAIVSWPATWANWVLQQNTNLSQKGWTSFSGPIGNDGITKSATNSSATDNRFFRLSSPVAP